MMTRLVSKGHFNNYVLLNCRLREKVLCMKCANCNSDTAHIKISSTGSFSCSRCGGWPETSGSRTDKILTRNADRITTEQVQFEGDMITPYVVDKSTNRAVVNEEFINLYPDKAASTYTADELKSVGQPDLKPSVNDDDGEGVEFVGDESEAIGAILDA